LQNSQLFCGDIIWFGPHEVQSTAVVEQVAQFGSQGKQSLLDELP
jgi:hypothetical protein